MQLIRSRVGADRALVMAATTGTGHCATDEIATWTNPAASCWVVVAGDPDLETRARQILPCERVGRFARNEGLARRLGELASSDQSPARLVSPAQLVPLYLTPSQAERGDNWCGCAGG